MRRSSAHAGTRTRSPVIVLTRRVARGDGILGFVVRARRPIPHIQQDGGDDADDGNEQREEFEEQHGTTPAYYGTSSDRSLHVSAHARYRRGRCHAPDACLAGSRLACRSATNKPTPAMNAQTMMNAGINSNSNMTSLHVKAPGPRPQASVGLRPLALPYLHWGLGPGP